MVEMLGLKKPLPIEISDSAISMIQIVSGLRSAAGLESSPSARCLRLLAVVEQRDDAVLIAADLKLLALVDEVARFVRVARRPVAKLSTDDLVALAVDHRIGLGRCAAEGEREIADRHQDRAELHRALGAEILVGEEAADQRRQIDERGIAAVEAGRLAVREEEMLGEIERQQRPHAVIAEPLPHLGGEQPRELARMAEPGASCRRG